jgi:hypothetical protein
MTEDVVIGLIFIAMGLLAGFGMLMVKPSHGEPEALAKMFPGATLYRSKLVRTSVALIGFCFVLLGFSMVLGWG